MARKSETRERLIQTATELFSRKGYGQTGVSEIMELAEATTGSFYHFFPAKEDLLLAVLDHVGETLESETFVQADQGAEDPIGKIFLVFGWYRRTLLVHDFALGSPVGTLAAELSESHPQVRSKLGTLFRGSMDRIEGFLREAGSRLPRNLDKAGLAQFIVATIEGAFIEARAEHSIEPFDAAVAQMKNYLRQLTEDAGAVEAVEVESPVAEREERRKFDWRAW